VGQTDPFIPDLSDVKIGILHLGNAIYELLNITELAISNGRGVLARAALRESEDSPSSWFEKTSSFDDNLHAHPGMDAALEVMYAL